MPDAAAAECQPLLQDEDAATVVSGTNDQQPRQAAAAAAAAPPLRVVIPGILLLILGEWSNVLIGVSMGALMERSICERQFPDVVDSLRDPRCKANVVQAELSTVRGWETTFLLVPGILTAVPYSMMAERYGPKLVVLLMFAGAMLTHITELLVCVNSHIFNTRWVWLCATFVVIGGGPVVFTAMVNYIGNSISSEKTRATTLLYCLAFAMLGGLTAGPVGFLLMKNGPVFTKCAVLVLGAAMFCLTLTMPADVIKRKQEPSSVCASSFTSSAVDGAPATAPRPLRQIYTGIRRSFQGLRGILFFNVKIFCLLSTLMLFNFATYATRFRLQYVTKRFGWTWDEAGFIPSIAAGIKLAVVGAVLPAVSYVLVNRFSLSGIRKDILLSRALVVILFLGSIANAVAPTGTLFIASVCFYELSAGHIPATVSLISSVADEQHKGVVFGYVALFEAMGGMASGPVLASLFNAGLEWGKKWYGLPFLFVAAFQMLSLVILFSIRERDRKGL